MTHFGLNRVLGIVLTASLVSASAPSAVAGRAFDAPTASVNSAWTQQALMPIATQFRSRALHVSWSAASWFTALYLSFAPLAWSQQPAIRPTAPKASFKGFSLSRAYKKQLLKGLRSSEAPLRRGSLMMLRSVRDWNVAKELATFSRRSDLQPDEPIAAIRAVLSIGARLGKGRPQMAELLSLDSNVRSFYYRTGVLPIGSQPEDLQDAEAFLRTVDGLGHSALNSLAFVRKSDDDDVAGMYTGDGDITIVRDEPASAYTLPHEYGHFLFDSMPPELQKEWTDLYQKHRELFGRLVSPYAMTGHVRDAGSLAKLANQGFAEMVRLWLRNPEAILARPAFVHQPEMHRFVEIVASFFTSHNQHGAEVRFFPIIRPDPKTIFLASGPVTFARMREAFKPFDPLQPWPEESVTGAAMALVSGNPEERQKAMNYLVDANRRIAAMPFAHRADRRLLIKGLQMAILEEVNAHPGAADQVISDLSSNDASVRQTAAELTAALAPPASTDDQAKRIIHVLTQIKAESLDDAAFAAFVSAFDPDLYAPGFMQAMDDLLTPDRVHRDAQPEWFPLLIRTANTFFAPRMTAGSTAANTLMAYFDRSLENAMTMSLDDNIFEILVKMQGADLDGIVTKIAASRLPSLQKNLWISFIQVYRRDFLNRSPRRLGASA